MHGGKLFLVTLALLHWSNAQSKLVEPSIRQLTAPLLHGEGPMWDARVNRLYFVDIERGQAFSYDPESFTLHNITFAGRTLTPFVPSRNRTDVFHAGLNRTLVRVQWDGVAEAPSAQQPIATVSEAHPTSRFNDGKADSRGRLWFGTMGYEDLVSGVVAPNAGALYRFDAGSTAPTVMISPVNVSNGLAWNRADDAFFYIDTPTHQVVRFDFDAAHGTIANRRVLLDTRKAGLGEDALPDGMTIDVDDNLWVALHGAGAVLHVNSTSGAILQNIAMPAQYVTSCMWGGRHLDVLFVTTSRIKLNPTQRLQQPAAGSLFSVEGLGTSGLPLFGGGSI